MIEAAGLTVGYGDFIAVDRAELMVRAGEVVALCGPNGSGKSSLIGALAGDIRPRGGAALIDYVSVTAMSPAKLARRRAVLEQSPSLSAPFTVRALAGLGVPRETPPVEAEAIARWAIGAVGLSQMTDQRANTLSGGQQRRAHLARALAQLEAGRRLGGGRALILDEPTAGLDIAHQIAALRAARAAADDGAAVLTALHDLSLAAAFADRIALMRGGRIVADAQPKEALTPGRLREVYEAPIDVFTAPDGSLCAAPAYAMTTHPVRKELSCLSQ